MSVYAGLDGGSTYLKAALIDQTGRVLNTGVVSTGIDNNGAAEALLKRLTHEKGIDRIAYTMATGYSRKILETADDDVSEITAHAYGVRITAPKGRRGNGQVHGGYRADTGDDHRPGGSAVAGKPCALRYQQHLRGVCTV